MNFTPGRIIKEFQTKKGNKAVIRYPKWEDLEIITEYINALSSEDTYITLSGEKITKEEEIDFLTNLFKGIELQNTVYLCCFVNNKIAGACSIERIQHARSRAKHIGVFGLTVAKEFRGEGIGLTLSQTAVEEAKTAVPGLRIIELEVYGNNAIAQNLYKKIGFKEYGIEPKAILYKDSYIDDMCMYLPLL